MTSYKCLFCGSSNLRADRALSGRLVCTSCGNPYGVRRRGGRNKLNNYNIFSFKKKYLFFVFIFIVALILVVI